MRLLRIYTFLILAVACGPTAFGQGSTRASTKLIGGGTLPSKCSPATVSQGADMFVKTGASAGLYYCSAANTWTAVGGSAGTGDVVGPGSSTDNSVVRFDLATGKLIQVSAVLIDDSGNVTGLGTLNSKTLPTGTDTLAGLGTAQTFTANQTVNSAVLTSQRNSIGATSTDGIVLQNTTAAAAGAQQFSPRIHFIGQGWKTNATAASQADDFIIELQPGQGAAQAYSDLVLSRQINGGGYNPVASFGYEINNSNPAMAFGGPVSANNLTGITAAPTSALTVQVNGINRGSFLASPSVLELPSTSCFGWSNSTATTVTPDTWSCRGGAAATVRQGAADNATPVANIYIIGESSRGGTDSNVAGANGTVRPGNGTGTGGSGAFKIQVAPPGSTGSVANTYADALSISNAKVATFSGDLQGVTATFSGAINVASCTGCGSGTTYATSGNYWPFPQENFGSAANSSALVGSANQVRAVKVFLNRAITVDRLGIKGAAGSAGLASFAIYNADGSSRLVYSGTIDSNTGWTSAQAVTVSASGTVGPGYVMVAWTADNTSATIYTHAYNSNWLQLQTVGTTAVVGTCANAATSGALPSTCGTFTADSSITNFPMLNWFKN